MRMRAAKGTDFSAQVWTPVGNSLSGTVAHTVTPLVAVSTSENKKDSSEFWHSRGVKTYAGFPILAGKKCLGTLTFAHTIPIEINPELHRWASSSAILLSPLMEGGARKHISAAQEASADSAWMATLRSIQNWALEFSRSAEELEGFLAAVHRNL